MEKISQPLISIIILNYNAGDLLLNCVGSVFKSTYSNLEVILVDNSSKDNSQIRCKEKFEKIKLIENEENLGYCEGNNVGIRNAKGDFILVLNPDTVVEPNWLEPLLDAYNSLGEGLYQPKILSLDKKETFRSTGNQLHIFGFGFARGQGKIDDHQKKTVEKIGYASGTCLFTSKEVLKKVGLLDSFLFLYHDDLDLGWRAAQIGINSHYVPNSVIYHVESYALKWSAKKFYWLERNRKYCILTHYSKKTYAKMLPSLILVDFFVWMFYLSKGFIGSKIKAEFDILRKKKFIEAKYNELERKKTIPDKELIKLFPDEVFVPVEVSDSSMNKLFNLILSRLSKRAKKSILS
jgi:GT2 family glycosyltransferase|tara:strand:- start:3148 stop:4197 length:1050 start_codon:yes stop_codon:yes gene_type:complete